MPNLEDLAFVPERFSGKVRLFPLPNLVMFPHVMQPLHIFEPRYREMLQDALSGDRLIAMALLAPGWERDYEGRPPLKPMACLGRIATFQRQPDDRYNVLLLGQRRVGMVRELPPERSFREAEVHVFEDEYPASAASRRPELQRRLIAAFRKMLPNLDENPDQLDQLLGANIPLGMLTDIVGYTLDLPLAVKEGLLAELNVDRRAALLLKQMQAAAEDTATTASGLVFPPEFSTN